MTWVPKSSAPSSFNLGEAFAAMITGDAGWGWLLGWVPVIGNETIDTAAFCAAGPPPEAVVDPDLFLAGAGRTPIQTALNAIRRVAVLRDLAASRTYAAYCEFSTPASSAWHTYIDQSGPFYPPGGTIWGHEDHTIPAGATQVRATYWHVSHPVEDGNTWQGRLIVWRSVAGREDRWDLPGADTTHADTAPGPYTYTGTLPYSTGVYQGFLVGNNGVQPDGRVLIEFNITPAGADPFTPDTPVQPPGSLPPATKTYTTIADLGAELDAQEFKLDHLTALVNFLGQYAPVGGAAEDTEVEAAPDTPIEIGDAVGVVITLDNIPPYADVEFATPQRVAQIGRVNLGTPDGWLPAFDIEVNPMVLAPIPPGVTRVQVNVRPGVTAMVRMLRPPK